jgi:hypothetical protein
VLLEELESSVSAWYKQACASSATIVHKIIRKKVLTNHCLLGLDNYRGSNAGSLDLRGDATPLIEL